jgi:NADH:ubiquinone oxidoreductase subunit 3 (subunit A)
MNATGYIVSIPQVTLVLMLFGAAIVWATQAIGTRSGGRGLLAFWLVASAALAGFVGGWIVSAAPGADKAWSYFLVPFLFLLVEIGAVALYVEISTRKGLHGRRQLVLGMIVFIVALIPAMFVAMLAGFA